VEHEIRVRINSDLDIVVARQKGRELAKDLGFGSTDSTLIATAISELARNIVLYAEGGEIILKSQASDPAGILVVAFDEGPGIADPVRAIHDGYSTSGSLGLGLPGVRRLMDEFEVVSEIGRGTTVTAKKWKR
jgi:serine/threonine-protein kinase RsbT